MAAKYRWLIATIAWATLAASCTSDPDGGTASTPKGVRAYADVTLVNSVTAETRANMNSYDHWTISSFGPGDEVGMITVYGRQNPDNPADFSLPVQNERMLYEGKMGTSDRFGTTSIVIDPEMVNRDASFLYYPYYPDMPDPNDASGKPGLPLRRTDGDIEKCIDFMCTIKWGSGTVNDLYRIKLTDGVLVPELRHYFTTLILQRGEGFDKAQDKRIWIVMKNPYTDIRFNVYHSTGNNSYYYHKYILQYNPDVFEEEGADLMVDIHRLPNVSDGDDLADGDQTGGSNTAEPFKVNKYALWESWEGGAYDGIESRYVVIPPNEDVFFIYIQDNYSTWQKVSDFQLDDGKKAAQGKRYTMTIQLVGTKVVVRPVAIESWDDEINIADSRKNGINDYKEYFDWATTYNAYIEHGRDEYYVEKLLNYGDGEKDTETGRTSWHFYINNDIEFSDTNIHDFAQVTELDDVLEGASTYTNYCITNLRNTMVRSMGANGVIRALDFRDIYLVQQKQPAPVEPAPSEPGADTDTDEPAPAEPMPYSALVGEMNGGTIERCNIINGVLVSESAVGMIAGKVTAGTVRNCTVSGNVIGTSTAEGYGGLFGTVEGNSVTVDNNKTSGLEFIEK